MQQQQPSPPRPTSIFCAAAPSDARFLTQWETHLLPLQQTGQITVWSEQHIMAGITRIQQTHAHLDQAQVILFLLSPDFFASDECMALLERALTNNARIIPLLLRPVDWKTSTFINLACLPANSQFVTTWLDQDDAFNTCVQDLRRLLQLPNLSTLPPQTHPHSPIPAAQDQNRVHMLRRLRRAYNDLMSQSLQGTAWLDLGLADKPAAVQNTANLLLRLSHRTEQHLPPGTSITQAYDEADHELLILGEPGAGKSTLLLDLAQHLVERAEQDTTHPLPIILPLSSWAMKRPPLHDWLAEQLSLLYDIPRKLSVQWVHTDKILPLLDGLDEMEETARPACITAINTYHRDHLHPLIVSSRTAEYEATSQQQRLTLQGAIIVLPLTHEYVDTYLLKAGKPLSTLRSALKKNTALHELATTPLMLNILTITYQDISIRGIRGLSNKTPLLLQQMWDDYIQRMVERKGDHTHYPLPQTRSWLGWLAQQMREHNQTVFYLEHLQPDWLLTKQQQRTYTRLAVRLPAIIIGVLISILIHLFLSGDPNDMVSLLQYAVLGGLLGELWYVSVSKQQYKEYPYKWGERLLKRIALSGCIGLIYGSCFGFDYHEIRSWLTSALSYGAGIGLGILLLQYLLTTPSRSSLSPENSVPRHWKHVARFFQRVQASHALLVAVVIWLSLGISDGLNFGLNDGISVGLRIGLPYALGKGLSSMLSYGLSYALISLVLNTQVRDIQLAERMRWAWKDLRRGLFNFKHLRIAILLSCISMILVGLGDVLSLGLSNWLIYGVSSGLSTGLIIGLSIGPSTGLSFGLCYWSLLGLFQGIIQERIEDQDRRITNQGVHDSLHNSVMMGIIGGGMIGSIGILSYELSIWLGNALNIWLNTWLSYGINMSIIYGADNTWLISGFLIGTNGALLICILTGGLAVWRHYIIRWLLSRAHIFPWQAPQFLADATARFLLRRIGGGYSFSHRLLLDHFANRETARNAG